MSTPSLGSAGNGAGGERFDVPGNLGSMSEIQQQLTILSRQLRELVSRFTDNEWRRAEEAANAAAMEAGHKVEEERRKGQEVREWNERSHCQSKFRCALAAVRCCRCR